MQKSDVLIIGGGLVGLATAYNYLKQHPESRVTLLEKEQRVGIHQSGRNSGVLPLRHLLQTRQLPRPPLCRGQSGHAAILR